MIGSIARRQDSPNSDAIRVSFVIPVKTDAMRLQRCLGAIAANGYPSEAVEIIVADNGSTDHSVQIARAAGARVISLPGLPVSEVRNCAAARARGDVIAFVDADHEVVPNWIATAVEILGEDHVGAAGALYITPADGTWVQRMYGALRGRTTGRSDVAWLSSGNLAIRREAFESVRGFDKGLESCEDVDLCQRLRSSGWRIVADERLGSVHLGDPATLAGLFRAERWRGRDNLRVTFRGQLTLRALPSILIPVVDAAAVLLSVAGLMAWHRLGPRALIAIAGACGWVLAAAGLRGAWMVASARLRHPLTIGQAFMVALTYDLGRCAALVTRACHHRKPSTAGR